MEIRFVDAENADFLALVQQLDEYYFEVVGEVHRRYAKYNDPRLLDARVVAYRDGKAAGCGAWKKIDAETAEIKRIFVASDRRRQGVASALIRVLERDVAARGFARAILETARTTSDSAALYHKLGFREIPYYGSPAGAENCRCFEKMLAQKQHAGEGEP